MVPFELAPVGTTKPPPALPPKTLKIKALTGFIRACCARVHEQACLHLRAKLPDVNRQLTIRGVSEEVGRRLESLSRSRGQSLNATVLEILESAVGVTERRQRLARYATWTAEDLEEFNEALAAQRIIDDPFWR